MSDIENDTPEEWVPFDTILCENDSCHDGGSEHTRYFYLGIGPFVSEFGSRSYGGRDVQLLLSMSGLSTWSPGPFMKTHYHIYNRKTCG